MLVGASLPASNSQSITTAISKSQFDTLNCTLEELAVLKAIKENPKITQTDKLNNIPDIAPLLSSAKNRNALLPIYGDERPLYQGLPPFIADSLPDSWGNTLFDKWVKDNKIPRNKVTPLYKLMFIGTRK